MIPDIRLIADGFSFLEGPRWHDGRLYVSDFYTGRVHAIDETGRVETVVRLRGQPSGLGFRPDGSLLIVSMIDRRLLRWYGGRVEEVADVSALMPDLANDMFVDEAGRAYISNFGESPGEGKIRKPTNLVMVDVNGDISVAAENMCFPNGVISGNELDRLLVAETFAARITVFDRATDGTLSNRRVWADFLDRPEPMIQAMLNGSSILPDGMVMDAEGQIWLGDAGGRGAVRVAEGGRVVDRISTGDLSVFATALGGADGRTLFMCAAPPMLSHDTRASRRACLLACQLPVGARQS